MASWAPSNSALCTAAASRDASWTRSSSAVCSRNAFSNSTLCTAAASREACWARSSAAACSAEAARMASRAPSNSALSAAAASRDACWMRSSSAACSAEVRAERASLLAARASPRSAATFFLSCLTMLSREVCFFAATSSFTCIASSSAACLASPLNVAAHIAASSAACSADAARTASSRAFSSAALSAAAASRDACWTRSSSAVRSTRAAAERAASVFATSSTLFPSRRASCRTCLSCSAKLCWSANASAAFVRISSACFPFRFISRSFARDLTSSRSLSASCTATRYFASWAVATSAARAFSASPIALTRCFQRSANATSSAASSAAATHATTMAKLTPPSASPPPTAASSRTQFRESSLLRTWTASSSRFAMLAKRRPWQLRFRAASSVERARDRPAAPTSAGKTDTAVAKTPT